MTFEMSDKAQTLKIYNLRPDTQEFIGRSDCYIPAHTGLPANCTLAPPPDIPVGSAAVYHAEQDKWSLVADHRGKTVYSLTDGSPQLITSLGDLPDGTVSTAPAEQYMKWDGSAWVHDANEEKPPSGESPCAAPEPAHCCECGHFRLAHRAAAWRRLC